MISGPVRAEVGVDEVDLARRVSTLRQLARQARALAERVAETEGVEWKSLAAIRFRDLLRHEAGLARGCADRLDRAADALARLAAAAGPGPGGRGWG